MISTRTLFLACGIMILPLFVMVFLPLYGFVGGLMLPIIVIIWQITADKRYPISVIVLAKRKDGVSAYYTKGGRFRERSTGKAFYRLKGSPHSIKPADFGNLIETRNGLWAMLYQPSTEEFAALADIEIKPRPLNPGEAPPEDVPVEIINGVPHVIPPLVPINKVIEGKLKVMDEDMKFWYANELERAYTVKWLTKKSKWEQYYPVISVAILGMMMCLILWVSAQYNTAVANQLSAAASAVSEAVKGLTGAVSSGGGVIR